MMPSINLILSSLFFVVLISELVTANFDPTGSLKQVEYAVKATAKGSTLIAIATTTDVILVSYNQKTDNSVVKQEKIKKISPYFVVGGAGLISDVSYLTNKIFEETLDYSSTFGSSPPIRKIASEIAELMHERTLIAAYRPFGAALCLAGLDDEVSPVLFEIDPTGSLRRKKLSSIGKLRLSD